MDKKQFNERVSTPGTFSSHDRGWLKAMQAKYPFSSPVSLLAYLADKEHGFDTPDERRAVALAVCDPAVIDRLLAMPKEASAPAPKQAAPAKPEVQVAPEIREKPAPEPEKAFDILSEINTYQEVSFKTAPKSVILSKFLQVGPQNEEESTLVETSTHDITDKKSLMPDVSQGTETLAIILEKQGRYDRALAIYKNLLANYPEKSSTFAPRIENLETLINSK